MSSKHMRRCSVPSVIGDSQTPANPVGRTRRTARHAAAWQHPPRATVGSRSLCRAGQRRPAEGDGSSELLPRDQR